jgi:hypothetical protein
MITKKTRKLVEGQIVYARWHGDNTFIVVREFPGPVMPHYICRLTSLYAIENSWIFPLIHLSTESIVKITSSHNRKQLPLFTNGNVFNQKRSTAASKG